MDEHDYLTDGNVYYHPSYTAKPKDVYDSEEQDRRNNARLSQIMANNSSSGTLTTNNTINFNSNGNVGIGTLGIATYLNILPTTTTPYSTFSSIVENQPETEEQTEEMIEDNNEEHLI